MSASPSSAALAVADDCYFNFSRPPFDSVEARQAIALAIDRDALNKSYAFGEAEPTSEVFPAGYWAADPDLQDTFAHDTDKAKELLAEAGHPDGLRSPGSTVQDTGEVRKMEIYQEQLKEVGIDMTFEVIDPATVAQKFFTEHSYDIAAPAGAADPTRARPRAACSRARRSSTPASYAAPGMDDALAAAAAGQTQETRAEAFSKVTELNQEYVLWLPFLSEPNVTAIDDKVRGLTPNAYGKIDVSFLSVG